MKQGFRGYVTHHTFGGNKIPIPMQNLILRDYTQRNELLFKLSVNEYSIPNCYIQLNYLLTALPTLEGIVMCSVFMMPQQSAKRREIYQNFLDQGSTLHLIFESTVIRTQEEVETIEEMLAIRDTLKVCPTRIPQELLPPLDQIEQFN